MFSRVLFYKGSICYDTNYTLVFSSELLEYVTDEVFYEDLPGSTRAITMASRTE
jgi:hypothetical protein